MNNKKSKFLLVGFLSIFFFFSFFQTSQAGFFDWFSWSNWFKKNDMQRVLLDNPVAKQYSLLISKTGSGSLTSDDGKINCGNNDSCGKIYTYAKDSKVVLTAIPNYDYVLSGWNGCDKVSDGKCQITINKSGTIVVKFVSKIAIYSSPQKSSSLSARKASSSKYSSSKSPSASSEAYSPKSFSSSKSSSSVSSKQTQNYKTLTIKNVFYNKASGVVKVGEKICDISQCIFEYELNKSLELQAVPNYNSVLSDWGYDCDYVFAPNNTCNLMMDNNKTVAVNFGPGISVNSSSSENTQNTQNTSGAQRTLVILVNSSYLDSRNLQLISSKDAYDVVFNKTDAFIRENSYGKTFLTGKVIGPYFIDTNDAEIDINKIFALADNDVDFTKYDRIVVFSSVSGRSSFGKQKYITPDGTAYFSIMYEGHYADYALAHEFGHSLGMYHTGFLMCDVRHTKANGCQTMITSGPFDPEGTGTGHYTAAHKDLIGWFSSQQAIVAKSSGLYSLEPLETNSNGPKTIKVSLGDNLYYYLEYRQPIGFDSSAKSEIPTHIEKHMYDGVLLYFAPKYIAGFGGGDNVHLFNPHGQIKVNEPEVNHTLKVGETFIDNNGIKISVIKADAESAQVSVYYPSL